MKPIFSFEKIKDEVLNFYHKNTFRKIIFLLFRNNPLFWKIVTKALNLIKAMQGNCIFCRIVKGDISSNKIYENDSVLAFYDINPQSPVHILVIPKKHISTILDISEEDKNLVFELIDACNKVARQTGISEKGFRIVVNTNPQGGQSVYHLHFHVMGGRQMRWPPG